jgi:hypothetical protein
MLIKILIAGLQVVVTVTMHAFGFASPLQAMLRSHTLDLSGFLPITGTVIGLACWLMLIHSAEIAVWGLFYYWQGYLPDAGSAFYFSGVTYTTVG